MDIRGAKQSQISNLTRYMIMKQTTPSITPHASQELDGVQSKTRAAAQTIKDYTFAQKAACVEKMQSEMAGINRDLDQIAAKIERSSAAFKAEAQPKLQALCDQMARFNKQLDAAMRATESTWEDVKAGSRTACNELKDGFQQARQWVSDKIAP
jgi:hypothetical protein